MYNASTRCVRESRNVLFTEPVSRLVQSTAAGGRAPSDFLVGTTGTDNISSTGVDVSSDSAADISNGEYHTMFTLISPFCGVVTTYIPLTCMPASSCS